MDRITEEGFPNCAQVDNCEKLSVRKLQGKRADRGEGDNIKKCFYENMTFCCDGDERHIP